MAGNPKAVRAVGGAMRRNPVGFEVMAGSYLLVIFHIWLMFLSLSIFQIPLIVPCHRVLCSSGESGRYMGGKGDHIKVWLLTHEKKALEEVNPEKNPPKGPQWLSFASLSVQRKKCFISLKSLENVWLIGWKTNSFIIVFSFVFWRACSFISYQAGQYRVGFLFIMLLNVLLLH